MGAKFDTEHIKMKVGQNLMERLREVLKEKGQADRMDSDNGLFFITEVTVKSINRVSRTFPPLPEPSRAVTEITVISKSRDEVLLEVGYEYGG